MSHKQNTSDHKNHMNHKKKTKKTNKQQQQQQQQMFHDNTDCDIASYADDNTPYSSSISLDKVINKSEASTNNLFKWFLEIT